MIAILMRKLSFLAIGYVGLVPRSDENVGHVETRHDSESLVDALVVRAGREQDFGMERVDMQFTHRPSDISQFTFVVESPQIV